MSGELWTEYPGSIATHVRALRSIGVAALGDPCARAALDLNYVDVAPVAFDFKMHVAKPPGFSRPAHAT